LIRLPGGKSFHRLHQRRDRHARGDRHVNVVPHDHPGVQPIVSVGRILYRTASVTIAAISGRLSGIPDPLQRSPGGGPRQQRPFRERVRRGTCDSMEGLRLAAM
jgi:hypothetical protein